MSDSRSIRFAVAFGAAALLATSCRDSTGPDTGTIMVTVLTTGTDIDPDGYLITLDGDAPRTIPVNASLSIAGVSAGDRSVVLSGLATNCTASPGVTITPAVARGGSVTAAFQVVCVARVGTVIVSTVTSGTDPDPDGYILGVESTSIHSVATTSVDTIRSVREGNRVLMLAGIATNCTVQGSATRTVNIAFNDTTRVGLAVNCVARRGSIRVNIFTVGNDMDDSYLVQVQGGAATSIGRAGTLDVANLAEGVYTVTLSGIASNCTVLGSTNPRSVTVVHGEMTTAGFTVSCVLRRSAIRVTTVTTGVELDPNGYTLYYQSYYSQTLSRSLSLNGSIVIGDLQVYDPYDVWIVGVERNCIVSGSTYRTLPVLTYGDTLDVTFTINCVASGTLQLNVATSGVEMDASGYSLRVTGTNIDTTAAVGINGTVTIPKLAPGDYQVSLYDVAANCETTGSNPRTVSVGAPGTTVNSFSVVCVATQDLAVVGSVGGHSEIFLVKSNGTGLTRITTTTRNSDQPSWSPDGSKIVFRSERDGNAEIYVMNANGANVVRLTNSIGADSDPAWSPDGSRIAFTSTRSGNSEIHVMDVDGTNVIRLTNHADADLEPTWSPDGLRIAFRSQRDGNAEIYVMSADGNAQTRLTFNELDDMQPAWSPDGLRIAFSRGACDGGYCGYHRIYTITLAGSALTRVTSGYQNYQPTWSPDGTRLAYQELSCDDYGCYEYVFTVRVAGLTTAPLAGPYVSDPAWRP